MWFLWTLSIPHKEREGKKIKENHWELLSPHPPVCFPGEPPDLFFVETPSQAHGKQHCHDQPCTLGLSHLSASGTCWNTQYLKTVLSPLTMYTWSFPSISIGYLSKYTQYMKTALSPSSMYTWSFPYLSKYTQYMKTVLSPSTRSFLYLSKYSQYMKTALSQSTMYTWSNSSCQLASGTCWNTHSMQKQCRHDQPHTPGASCQSASGTCWNTHSTWKQCHRDQPYTPGASCQLTSGTHWIHNRHEKSSHGQQWTADLCCQSSGTCQNTNTHNNNNNNRLFMASHLVRAQSTYKHIRTCSFHYTHTHIYIHTQRNTYTNTAL